MSIYTLVLLAFLGAGGLLAWGLCRVAHNADEDIARALDERLTRRTLYPSSGRQVTVFGADPRVLALMRQGVSADEAVHRVFEGD
ncbi:MAG TPA: hypothetical protein VFZ00_20535 [Solirubrobacter sp.]|nr:hypothetical protein [Solirubrobacter sp.]